MAYHLAHQRGLPLVPYGGQTYKAWQVHVTCTCWCMLWGKMEKWSWSTAQRTFYPKREPGCLPTQLVRCSLQLRQAHDQIQSMLYLSAMWCLVFPKAHRLQRHERSCKAKVKRVYPGGVYHPSQIICEKIEEEGIAVPPELKYSRYRATFDIEVYYPAHGTNLPEKRDKLEYTAEHQFLSISVASKVLGYEEPQCFMLEDKGREATLQTVTAFVEHLKNRRASRQVGMATLCTTLTVKTA